MMNKNMRTFAWTLAIAIATLAMPLTACSSDDSPAEGPRLENGHFSLKIASSS